MVNKISTKKEDMLIDAYSRRVNYMRLSVTDRCNLKCVYCHPPQKIEYMDRKNICTYNELFEVANVAAKLGVQKIRLTGGELFLRKDIVKFIHSLHEIDGIREIVLTTNGILLVPHLKKLKEMGIKRINVSLDTLSKDVFYRLTGSHKYDSVLEGIHKASEMGFKIKVNMVVLRGINENEIVEFVQYFLKKSVEVRFIEFMPLCGQRWREDYFFAYKQILEMITKNFDLQLSPSTGVAQEFIVSNEAGSKGKVGIISPVTRSFCSSCSRIRLSANGDLRPCLFSTAKIELLPVLRENISLQEKEKKISEAFKEAVKKKPLCKSQKQIENNIYIRSLGG